MTPTCSRSQYLKYYFLLTYIACLCNTAGYIGNVPRFDGMALAFTGAVFFFYGFIYVVAAFIPIWAADALFNLPYPKNLMLRMKVPPNMIVYILAIFMTAVLQLIIFADKFIFKHYDFHLNGFVWNLISTEGGLESMGSSTSTYTSFAVIVLGFIVLQTFLLLLIVKAQTLRQVILRRIPRRTAAFVLALLIIFGVFQAGAYGLANIKGYGPVLTAADAFPLYLPVTFKKLAQKIGIESNRDETFRMKTKSIRLRYPLAPLQVQTLPKQYNIVWLVSESWRSDMLDEEIMPATWAFAQRSVSFARHYSGGNGTRMGMFSMFYGLYGNYWFSFLNERRGPVLIDLLLDKNYQMKMFTSARFTYPEFDQTLFARLDPALLIERQKGLSGWENDRHNVTQLLDFIDQRQPDRPFMTFMFFESPHANYYFPPECVIRPNYLPDLNYATMDPKRDALLIKNRYINSCYHLDTQFARILEYLESNDLLDSTLVLLTGDHGEEFMEKSHWGHNSTFSEEQTRVPLILHIPGQNPQRITRMTSHLDIPPTLLPLLGVTNPPEDYCLGRSLFDTTPRDYVVISDWRSICYSDGTFKAVFPVSGYNFSKQTLSLTDDTPIESAANFYQTHRPALLRLLKELRLFGT